MTPKSLPKILNSNLGLPTSHAAVSPETSAIGRVSFPAFAVLNDQSNASGRGQTAVDAAERRSGLKGHVLMCGRYED